MGNFLVTLPPIWEAFLKGLADDHDIDISNVISGLCDWAFSSSDYKVQFEAWLDKAYPPKGQAQDRAKVEGEEKALAKKRDKTKRKKKPMKTETTVKIDQR